MTIEKIKEMRDNYNRMQNEGGDGYNPYDEMLEQAIIDNARKPIWTKEQTIANRQEWNTEVKKLISAHNGGHVPTKEVIALEDKMGFTLSALKAEIVKWGLK